jgi:hypothetical protein
VLCRTPFARECLEQLVRQDRVHCIEVTEQEVVESQTANVAFGNFSYAYAEFLKDSKEYCPDLAGPNRVAAKLWPRRKVARFHRETQTKLRLQRAARYRWLWWRKLLREFRPFAYRYLRWFFVRILRVKSLLGFRKEIPHSRLREFR